jgi:hypothetical protein
MVDIQRMACPECGQVNAMFAVVNEVRQFVCRRCGEIYYTPNDCLGEMPPEKKPGDEQTH